MAGRTAILSIKILADATDAQKNLDQAATGFEKFESGMSRAALPAAAVVGAIGMVGKSAYDSANRTQQAMGALDSVFGANSAVVKGWADDAATNLGLSRSAYGELASVVGAQLNNLTGNAETALSGTNQLMGLGADLAATFGGTTSDAVGALSAALRGEADPAERYGLSLNQTAVNAYLAANGLSGLEGDALTAAKAQAILDLATQQAGGALGQFQRESDTAAGSTQIASAQFENAKSALGEKLLPIVSEVMGELGKLATVVQDNSDAFLIIGGILGGVAGSVLAVNGAIKVYNATTTAIGAGKAIVSGVATQVGRLRDGWNSAGAAASKFSGTAGSLGGALRKVSDATMSGVKAAGRWVAAQAKSIASGVRYIASLIAQRVAQVAGAVATGIATAATWLWNVALLVATSPITLIVIAVLAVIAVFVLLWVKVKGFRDFFIAIWEGIKTAFTAVWNVIQTIVQVVIAVITAYIKIWLAVILVAWQLIQIGAKAVWDFILQVWDGIKAAAMVVFDWLVGIAATVWAFIVGAWEGIRNAAQTAWQFIKNNVIQPVWDWIVNAALTVWSYIVGAWNGIRDAATTAWNWIKDNVVQPVMDRIKTAVQNARDVINNVWQTIKDAGSTIWDGIKSAAETAMSPIKTAINKVKDAFDAVKSAVQNVIDILGRIKVPDVVDKISGWLGIGGRSAPVGGASEGFAPFAELGYSGYASQLGARSLAPVLAPGAGNAPAIQIVVQGALDPVAVAAQIRAILRDDTRRRSGVQLSAVTA
jgi:phage-related protein